MSSFIRKKIRIEERLDVMSEGRVITANKGDIITDNGTKTIKLSVGTNNQALIADSTQSEGVKWTDLAANHIVDFDAEVSNNTTVVSNINHTINTSNPHSVTKTQVGLDNVENLKTNLTATDAPTINEDSTDGYSIGSIWIDITNDKGYICLNASTGAAVWTEITNQGEVASISNIGTAGVGLFKQKNGTAFEFRSINSGSSKITVINDTDDDEVDIDVDESNIPISNLLGAPVGDVVGTSDVQVMTNKTFTANTTCFQDNTDNTKKLKLQLSGITTSITRTLTVPNANTTIVGHDATQILTNKTIDVNNNTLTNISNNNIKVGAAINANKIADGSVSNIEFQYLDGLMSSAIGISDNQTLTNKTLTDTSTLFQNDADNTKKLKFELSSIATGLTRTLTVPNDDTTIVGTDSIQTLTNKTFGSTVNLNGNKIINCDNPVNNSDVATKSYVDSFATGLDLKESVKLTSTVDLDSNASISGPITYNATAGASGRGQITATLSTTDTFTLDGVNLSSTDNNERILLRTQTQPEQNGIWTITISGTNITLDRAIDFDEDAEVTSGAYTYVEEGSTCGTCQFALTTHNPITVGGSSGTDLIWTQISGAGQITPGTGMTKNGNVLNVGGSNTILANANTLEVNSSATPNQILLSSGTTGTTASYGALPLGDSNSVSGVLTFANGGTNTNAFGTPSRIVATNSNNNALETTNLNPSDVITLTGTQTLTNKTFIDSNTLFEDDTDDTKKMRFQLSGITTGNTRIMTMPDSDIVMVGLDTTQILTNKTIDADNNTISNIDNGNIKSNAGIDATKIANGSISNTEFQLLNGISSTVVGISDAQILTNKTLTDSNTYFQDNSDNTKKVQLELSGISTSTTRVLTVPDANIILVGTNNIQTLENKTIDANNNTVSNIANASIKTGAGIDTSKLADGSVSNTEFQRLDGISSTVVGISDTQILTNKTFTDNSTYFQDNADNSKKIQFQLGNLTTSTTRILTIPDANIIIVGTNTIQTLENKIIDADNNTVTNIENSAIKSGAGINATKIADGSISNTEFQQLNGITSSVVGINDVQTLTNKTLTSPQIQTSINDTNGNELLAMSSVVGAVNELSITNAITTNGPSLAASGNDTNIDLNISPKGMGKLVLDGLNWPNADGSPDQVLKTDGAGNLMFGNAPILDIGTATTTNNIQTTISTISTANNTVYMIEAHIAARRTDAGTEGGGFVLRTAFRNDAGTVTKIGEDKMYARDSPWEVDASVSGTDIIIAVTGENSKTINWKCTRQMTTVG